MSIGLAVPRGELGASFGSWSIGPDAGALQRQWAEILDHFTAAISQRTLEQEFSELEATWLADTEFVSANDDLIAHPAYQRVIGLGPSVVPIILRQIQERPTHWFAALAALTGADPVPPEHRGDVPAMTDDWVTWGKLKGLLS
jgi:hypothetical protein